MGPDEFTVVGPLKDPSGGGSIFAVAGSIPFEAPADEIFMYVEEKAQAIGLKVKRNRGLPPFGKPENMLSPEEKSVVILGRSVGVSWPEISKRLHDDRVNRGEIPPSCKVSNHYQGIVQGHERIVVAIHADMLEGIEAYSPLVGGSGRIIWRAKLLEFYRQRIFALARNPRIKLEKKERRIASLDKAMEKHIRFFDGFQKEEDMERLLGSPAERMKTQFREKAEDEIAKRFANDEITDEERIDELRKLRHGELE